MSALTDPGPGGPDVSVAIPIAARVHLAHAVVQHLADRAGVDILHIKGPALLPDLRPAGRTSSDVDVLVRPAHLHCLVDELEGAGWTKRSDFATGSIFAHAANWWHDDWGYVDVHVHWPGVNLSPAEAFDIWTDGAATQEIAHTPCPVPDRIRQLLVLVLHAARGADRSDIDYAWANADAEQQAAARALTRTLQADVALAAALDELEQFRHDPSYELWRLFSQGGGTRFQEWRARFKAASSTRERLELAAASLRVNRDHLSMELGRPPTRRDLRQRQLLRVRRAAEELRTLVPGRKP